MCVPEVGYRCCVFGVSADVLARYFPEKASLGKGETELGPGSLGSQACVLSLSLCLLGSWAVLALCLPLPLHPPTPPPPSISHWPSLAQLFCLFHFLAGWAG